MFTRPRTILLIALATITTYFLVFAGPSHRFQVVPYMHDRTSSGADTKSPAPGSSHEHSHIKNSWDFSIDDIKGWTDPDDKEDPNDIEPGYETDGVEREPGEISKTQHEKDLRKMWRYAYKMTAK
jgi:hypothetical protein